MKHIMFIFICFLLVCCASTTHPQEKMDVIIGARINVSTSQDVVAETSYTRNWCYCIDRDGDGFGDPQEGTNSGPPPTGYVHNCFDVDDERTDGCETTNDTNCTWFCVDADGDGEGGWNSLRLAIRQPTGYVQMVNDSCTDCDDSNATINHSASETCMDTTDKNCDGLVSRNTPSCLARNK